MGYKIDDIEELIRENSKLKAELNLYRLFSVITGLLWVLTFVLSALL